MNTASSMDAFHLPEELELTNSSNLDKQNIDYFASKIRKHVHALGWLIPDEASKAKFTATVIKMRTDNKFMSLKTEYFRLSVFPNSQQVAKMLKLPFQPNDFLVCLLLVNPKT